MPHPITQLDDLLKLAQEKGASDLHISANQPIMIRVDGQMTPLDLPILDAHTTKQLFCSVMNDDQIHTWQNQLELDFSSTSRHLIRYRANVFHQAYGPAGVFRLISCQIPTLDSLGLPANLTKLAELSQGLVLVTGATGSGKSSTLAALIHHINQHKSRHIITIEDPIEFLHSSQKSLINQRQVNSHTHSFNQALRSALREDPDVILIGEMRDVDTIRLALSAAETGHLVLATLHTSSAAKSIHRIIDVFDSAEKELIKIMLSESLQAIICQKLLPACGGGRVAACEILVATPAIRNLIRENKIAQIPSVIATGSQAGMLSLENSLKQLLSQAKIDAKTIAEFLSPVQNSTNII